MIKLMGWVVGLAVAGGAAYALAQESQSDDHPGRSGRHGGRDQAWLLEKYDTNHNGVLDPEERDAARKEFRGRRGETRGRLLERYDTNKNGVLDPEEKAALQRDREARRAEMLKRFDTNGDGKLDATEREALRKEMREKHQEREQ